MITSQKGLRLLMVVIPNHCVIARPCLRGSGQSHLKRDHPNKSGDDGGKKGEQRIDVRQSKPPETRDLFHARAFGAHRIERRVRIGIA